MGPYKKRLAIIFSSTIAFQALALEGYTANYHGTYKSFDITAERTLSCEKSICELSTNATAFLGEIKESSKFSYVDDQLSSLAYQYTQHLLLSKRERTVHFDGDGIAHYEDRKGTKEVAYPSPTYDNLNYQLAVSEAAKQGESTVNLNVLRRGKIVEMLFEKVKEEEILVNGERLNTVHFRQVRENSTRQTDIWLAPSLQGVLVRLKFVKDNDESTLELASFVSHQALQTEVASPSED